MKTMCPPGYDQDGIVASHALIYALIYIYIYFSIFCLMSICNIHNIRNLAIVI